MLNSELSPYQRYRNSLREYAQDSVFSKFLLWLLEKDKRNKKEDITNPSSAQEEGNIKEHGRTRQKL